MALWLELRSGAPGLPGPFLLEHRHGYQVLDGQAAQPRVVLAIGGKIKRRFMRRLQFDSMEKHGGVSLRRSHSVLLIDCEMHDSRLPRVKAGPRVESTLQHHLSTSLSDCSPVHRVARFAHTLYWQSLVPFAPVILLFLEDLGGLPQVTEMLAAWAARPNQCAPRVIIVHDSQTKVTLDQVEFQLHSKLKYLLRKADPETIVRRGRNQPFELIKLHPISLDSASQVPSQIEESFLTRDRMGLAFHGQHLKYLLHQSIRLFTKGETRSFNFYAAARASNPVSPTMAEAIASFLEASEGHEIDQSSIIASALALDARPPGMHGYGQNSSTSYGRERAAPSLKPTWHTLHAFMLFGQPIAITKSVRGQSEGQRHCPLCRERNEAAIILRPLTAGSRVLKIGGPTSSKVGLFNFLQDLQSLIGLPLHPLREQFDVVIGYDIGAFLVHAIFIAGWTIADVKHHLDSLSEAKLVKKGSIASFGDGLRWDFAGARLFNGADVILLVEHAAFFNTNTSSASFSLPKIAAPNNVRQSSPAFEHKSDVVIQCSGDKCDPSAFHLMASKMVSSLFYIELVEAPTFYTVPETVHIRLKCRLPAGTPLTTLLFKLRLKNTRIYMASGGAGKEEMLVTPSALARCKAEWTVGEASRRESVIVLIQYIGLFGMVALMTCSGDKITRWLQVRQAQKLQWNS
ncbi:hypothetical protein JX265_013704 [Neoarthrinium moseri]|uniref:Uncharacterized protein n=1 Tax=Neoarthrinium moseri TaxID=1658444 RepID=A0A9Q0AFP0_9PEZI|nr:hypothetical protein JX266_012091 [Neoarthrinium moseri]KAI1849007.1 hypothetical protein JX265_013704 [Neoarthrinium moseri]